MKIIAEHLVVEGYQIKKVYEVKLDGRSVYVMVDNALPDDKNAVLVFVNKESFNEMSNAFKADCLKCLVHEDKFG